MPAHGARIQFLLGTKAVFILGVSSTGAWAPQHTIVLRSDTGYSKYTSTI